MTLLPFSTAETIAAGVGGVCGAIGLAEISSDAYGRKNEPARNFTEVAGGRAAFEARGIAQSAFWRGETSFAFFGYAEAGDIKPLSNMRA